VVKKEGSVGDGGDGREGGGRGRGCKKGRYA